MSDSERCAVVISLFSSLASVVVTAFSGTTIFVLGAFVLGSTALAALGAALVALSLVCMLVVVSAVVVSVAMHCAKIRSKSPAPGPASG